MEIKKDILEKIDNLKDHYSKDLEENIIDLIKEYKKTLKQDNDDALFLLNFNEKVNSFYQKINDPYCATRLFKAILNDDVISFSNIHLAYYLEMGNAYVTLNKIALNINDFLLCKATAGKAFVYFYKVQHLKNPKARATIGLSLTVLYKNLLDLFTLIGDEKRRVAFNNTLLDFMQKQILNDNFFDFTLDAGVYILELMYDAYQDMEDFDGIQRMIGALYEYLPILVQQNKIESDEYILLENTLKAKEALTSVEYNLKKEDERVIQHHENVKFYLNDYVKYYDIDEILEYYLLCVSFKNNKDFPEIEKTLSRIIRKISTPYQFYLLASIYDKLAYDAIITSKDYIKAVGYHLSCLNYYEKLHDLLNDYKSLSLISYTNENIAEEWEELHDVDHARAAITRCITNYYELVNLTNDDEYRIDLFYALVKLADLNFAIRRNKIDLKIYEEIFSLIPIVKKYDDEDPIDDIISKLNDNIKIIKENI